MILGKLIPRGKSDKSGFCNAAADLILERVEASTSGSGPCELVRPAKNTKKLTLLNLLHAPKESKLARVASLFTKIESIGYILAWSESERDSVQLVELPRLRLSFVAAKIAGRCSFLCNEHAGLFVPSEPCSYAKQLITGLPCALLLSNSTKEFFIMMNAAVKPLRPNQRENFPNALLLDRADRNWLSNLSVPHYLYQIHVSRRFLIMPALASMLYLLLLRFHARQYSEIFMFVYSCVSDVELTREERQVPAVTFRFNNFRNRA